eukprot:scaffold80177_cov41-Prasinocladus_malaysianus.AAC.2
MMRCMNVYVCIVSAHNAGRASLVRLARQTYGLAGLAWMGLVGLDWTIGVNIVMLGIRMRQYSQEYKSVVRVRSGDGQAVDVDWAMGHVVVSAASRGPSLGVQQPRLAARLELVLAGAVANRLECYLLNFPEATHSLKLAIMAQYVGWPTS